MDGGESGKVFENPPDMPYVKMGVIAVTLGLLSGLLITLIMGRLEPFLIFLGVSIFALMPIWFREYFKRPKHVQIEREGVRFFFRYSRPRFIIWDEITAIRWDLPDPNSWSNRDGMGTLRIPNQTVPYCLTPAIAQKVAEAYRRNTGREPSGMRLKA